MFQTSMDALLTLSDDTNNCSGAGWLEAHFSVQLRQQYGNAIT
jgi:hypothetical protein